jgi:hypothetical protein
VIYFTPSKIFSYAWCELERTIDEGRYPLSLRVQALRTILAKLGAHRRAAAQPEPPPNKPGRSGRAALAAMTPRRGRQAAGTRTVVTSAPAPPGRDIIGDVLHLSRPPREPLHRLCVTIPWCSPDQVAASLEGGTAMTAYHVTLRDRETETVVGYYNGTWTTDRGRALTIRKREVAEAHAARMRDRCAQR